MAKTGAVKLEAAYEAMVRSGRTSGPVWNRVCADMAKVLEADYARRPRVKLNLDNQDLILGGYAH